MIKEVDEAVNRTAEACLERGLSVIPISRESKEPMIRWGECIERPLKYWAFNECNLAIITGEINNVIIVDCDSLQSYACWLRHMPKTPLRVKTRRGMHFYYRHPGEYVKSGAHLESPHGFEYDVKGDRSYALMPPSLSSGHQYQICVCSGNIEGKFKLKDCPVFDPKWRPDTTSSERAAEWNDFRVKDAEAYISTIMAVEGHGGDKDTWRVCHRLRDAGLDELEAISLLFEWNTTNARPPWSTKELYRKIKLVYSEG